MLCICGLHLCSWPGLWAIVVSIQSHTLMIRPPWATSALLSMTSQHVGLSRNQHWCSEGMLQAIVSAFPRCPGKGSSADFCKADDACHGCAVKPFMLAAHAQACECQCLWLLLAYLSLRMILLVFVQNTLVGGRTHSHKLTHWVATGLHLHTCQLSPRPGCLCWCQS